MKNILPILITSISTLFIIPACQKSFEIIDTPAAKDSTIAAAFIDTNAIASFEFVDYNSGDSGKVSFQYDTANRKMNIYVDDPTTATLYDQLLGIYAYNADGFLIKAEMQIGTPDAYSAVINRNAANSISSIDLSYNRAGTVERLTRVFTYNQTGSNVIEKVVDSVSTDEVTYNVDKRVIEELHYWNIPGTTLTDTSDHNYYFYNSDGTTRSSLHHSMSGTFSSTDTINYTAYEQVTNNTLSAFNKLLLGKDWYTVSLQDYSPFHFGLTDFPANMNSVGYHDVTFFTVKPEKAIEILTYDYSNNNPIRQEYTVNYNFDNSQRISEVLILGNNTPFHKLKLHYNK